jgi:hypothetical protein
LLLYKHSEIISYSNLEEKQSKYNAIFASSLDQNSMPYKLGLVVQKKPKVVALGSSTSMQFRHEFFASDIRFVNAGGAAASASDLFNFSKAMLAVHKPELVIIGVDFWWLNPERSNPVRPIAGTLEEFNLQKIIAAGRFLWRFGDSFYLYRDAFALGDVPIHAVSGMAVMGFDALERSDGFRPDGSRLYYQYVSGQRSSSDTLFSSSFQRIKQGNNRFEYASELDLRQYRILMDTIRLYEAHNVTVIVFLPPVAPVIAARLQAMPQKYAHIVELQKKAQKHGWFDYLTPREVSWDECEFIDGFHMGDILAQRLLIDIEHQKPLIKPYLNSNAMTGNIDKFKGRVLSIMPNDGFPDGFIEQDFLQLGCLKK